MKTVIAYAVLGVLAAVGGKAAHHATLTGKAEMLCAGGAPNPLSLDVMPTRADRMANGERLTLGVHLSHQLAGSARIRYVVELLDDVGRSAAPVWTSPVHEVGLSSVLNGSDVVVPESLPDGDYQLRVTAVAKSLADGRSSVAGQTIYLRRKGGMLSELSTAEWFTTTRANTAQVLSSASLAPPRVPRAPVESPAPTVTPCPSPQGVGEMVTTTCTPLPPPDPPPVASGFVSGQLAFFNHQGNFCPARRDCTGAKYLQSEFDVVIPVRDTRVYIRRASDALVIGQGTSDAAGNFSIQWTINNTSGDVSANVIWVGEQKDGRFAIRTDTGAQWVFSTLPLTLHDGGSDFTGTLAWGNAQSPNALANVYDGAWRTWNQFSLSNRMLAYFTNLEIRTFPQADCPNSCAFGPENRILLDPGSPYAPQGRVMHEMGHIASYRSNRDQQRRDRSADYCFPNQSNANCGWDFTTAEWGSAAFEEGLATFYGDTVLYSPSATAPHTCTVPEIACPDGVFNIEESHAQCASDENRWPLTTVRYLWDAYDSNVDYAGETLQRNSYEFFDTINAFDNGTGNHQKDEPWCCDFFGCSLCDRDGRTASDFRWNWANWGTDSSFAFTNNCSPQGD